MHYKQLFAVSLLSLSSCSDDQAIKEAVRSSLKDLESARFSSISVSERGMMACATVNAKNSMGGYTGDSEMILRRFVNADWLVDDSKEITHVNYEILISKLDTPAADKYFVPRANSATFDVPLMNNEM